jgi:hypothetical protein
VVSVPGVLPLVPGVCWKGEQGRGATRQVQGGGRLEGRGGGMEGGGGGWLLTLLHVTGSRFATTISRPPDGSLLNRITQESRHHSSSRGCDVDGCCSETRRLCSCECCQAPCRGTCAKALTQVAPAIAGHLRCQLLLPLKLQRPDIPMMSNSIMVSTGKTGQ